MATLQSIWDKGVERLRRHGVTVRETASGKRTAEPRNQGVCLYETDSAIECAMFGYGGPQLMFSLTEQDGEDRIMRCLDQMEGIAGDQYWKV